MRNSGEKRLQRLVTFLCSAAFAAYSFFFVAVYKAAVLQVVYDSVATGRLQFNAYVVAGVVTAILVGLALWLNRFAKFQREWTAMAFVPSAVLLAFVTDIDRSFFTGNMSFAPWLWLFGGVMLVYALFAFVLRRILFEKIKNPTMMLNRILWRNTIGLAVVFFAVGCLSAGDCSFNSEVVQYKHFVRGDIDAALKVGRRSPHASMQLTAQRAFLLSQKGELGERLFEFPILFGADALLPSVERDAPIVPDTVYAALGTLPVAGERVMEFLRRVAENSTVAVDYYLCALLAERRLVDFCDKVYEFYKVSDNLPRHYKEALLLYSYVVPSFELPFEDAALQARFNEFLEHRKSPEGAMSVCTDTYWWYFLYGA